MTESSIFYTEDLQLNKLFFSAGNSSHVQYGKTGNWNFMERTLYCGVELFCFQYQYCKTFPLHCFLGWPCFIQFDSVFQPLKIYTNNNTDFCLHSTYNIKSKALVNQPALLRTTAGGRCGK